MVFCSHWVQYGDISPFTLDPTFIQHIYKMYGIFH